MPSTTTPGEAAGGSPAGGPSADGSRAGRTGPRRRSVLAGTAGALVLGGTVAGCTGEGESPAERRHRIDTARRLRRDAARDSEALLTRYTSTAAVHPALGGRLAPLREAVARHVEAFGGTVRDTGDGEVRSGKPRTEREPGKSEPEDAPTGGPGAGNRMAVPGDERRALAALADAERRTADVRMRALVEAPPELARVLASVAAAGSTHAFLLTEEGA